MCRIGAIKSKNPIPASQALYLNQLKYSLVGLLFLFTCVALPWGSNLCVGCRLDSSALAGPIYTFPDSAMFQQMISTNGTFLFQDDVNRLPVYSSEVKMEIRVQDKAQLRLAYDVNNYIDFRVGSSGSLTINVKDQIILNPMRNVVVASSNLIVFNGNLGIGVVAPSEALDVSGNIKLSGANSRILNVPAPIASGDVANKGYVDASTAGNAQETSLTDIKGSGFTPANASLKVISDKVALQSTLLGVSANVAMQGTLVGVSANISAVNTAVAVVSSAVANTETEANAAARYNSLYSRVDGNYGACFAHRITVPSGTIYCIFQGCPSGFTKIGCYGDVYNSGGYYVSDYYGPATWSGGPNLTVVCCEPR